MELNLQFYWIYSNSYKFQKFEPYLELIWLIRKEKRKNDTIPLGSVHYGA
jgi:hypothetical protein